MNELRFGSRVKSGRIAKINDNIKNNSPVKGIISTC
jgi:hypothetical protein